MKLEILFWFYKDIPVCKNRLKLIRKYNPNTKVYGLYGGSIRYKNNHKKALSYYLDDFYTCPFKSRNYKWLHGDLVLLDWYMNRGKALEWDSIFVAQWDMPLFTNIREYFTGIKNGEIFLSGLRDLDKNLRKRWDWTDGTVPEQFENYLKFTKFINTKYNYKGLLKACIFICNIFPREFFDKYHKYPEKEVGFLEYKIPTLAKIYGIPFFEKDVGVWWSGRKKNLPMNAMDWEIRDEYIRKELAKKNGWRMFHPHWKVWNEATPL